MEETWEFAALGMVSRPAIPVAIKRAVEVEAGYRCAIPTCRDKGPHDFEHIDEWSKVKTHEFHNIILLCVGCHARVTRKNTSATPISKDALRKYKRNLAITNGRYSLFEMRLLENYYACAKIINGRIDIPQQSIFFITDKDLLHLGGLLHDGYISLHRIDDDQRVEDVENGHLVAVDRINEEEVFSKRLPKLMDNRAEYFIFLTDSGLEFIKDYFEGNEIE